MVFSSIYCVYEPIYQGGWIAGLLWYMSVVRDIVYPLIVRRESDRMQYNTTSNTRWHMATDSAVAWRRLIIQRVFWSKSSFSALQLSTMAQVRSPMVIGQ